MAASDLTSPKSEDHSIAILMPAVWAIRNVVHSGVLERLANAGVKVHLLMRDFDPSTLHAPEHADFSPATSCLKLSLPSIHRRIRGRGFLRDVIQSAFSRRNKIGSYALYRRWFSREYTRTQRFRARITDMLGSLAQPAPVFFRLCTLYDILYRFEFDIESARAQLQRIGPSLIWSTVSADSKFERAYKLAARDLQIPVVNSILSFDNLTTKPTFMIYDYYLVWNEGMKAQLLKFHPQVSNSQVAVTGTPQFDFHCRPEFRWSREKTLKRLKLPPRATYFLYTLGTRRLTPKGPELVASLARRMREDPALRNHWLVVRTHPLEDWTRWGRIEEASDRVRLSTAWDATPDDDHWVLPTAADQVRFISSIAHAAACLNIASTTALDAAILDRPVIGIRFDCEKDAPEEMIYEEYDADHYRPLVLSRGVHVARSWVELLDLMKRAVKWPEENKDARARMVAQECGIVDGRAGQRVANALLDHMAKQAA